MTLKHKGAGATVSPGHKKPPYTLTLHDVNVRIANLEELHARLSQQEEALRAFADISLERQVETTAELEKLYGLASRMEGLKRA